MCCTLYYSVNNDNQKRIIHKHVRWCPIMSLILDTFETNTWISHISEDARKHLVIICPYLKINEKLRRTIEVADRKGVNIFVIYGKRELDEGTMTWLKGLRHSNIASIKDLHAKLYMNEEFAVISSMNLYEYSQVNNEELGVLCGRKEDRAEFKDITFQVMRLIGISEKEHGKWEIGDLDKPIRGLFKRSKGTEEFRTYGSGSDVENRDEIPSKPLNIETEEKQESPVSETILCHCIRCGRVIPSTHDYVYCGRCMDSWQRYSNMKYVEPKGHCYVCGKECEVSAEKPACLDCYRSHKELVESKCSTMRALGR